MKNISLIVLVGVVILLGFTVVTQRPNQSNNTEKVSEIVKLSEEIKNTNGQFIDVREVYEYEESHADGSANIPMGVIMSGDFSGIDKDRPVYLICRTGRRAGEVKAFLEQSGFSNVKNVGGVADWESQGDKVCAGQTKICSAT